MKLFVAVLSVAAAALPGFAEGYRLIKKIPVPGDGGWDYLTVDAGARRLYISHGSQVEVVDADTGDIAGRITETKGVHGIAVVPELGRGFISNGGADTVTIFNLKTLARIMDVKTGKNPDAIVYDPATRRIFADNNGGDSTTVIDAATGKVAGTIELGGAPEFAASDGKGAMFVNLEDKNETLKLDARNLKVLARWPLAPCETPTSMAIDTKNSRLFIGCRNGMMAVVDSGSGKVVGTAPIGDGVDATIFDAAAGEVLFSNGDGTVNVFHQDSPDKYTPVQTVKTQPGAKTMALDPKTGHLFLSAAEFTTPGGGRRRVVQPGTFAVLVFGK